MNDHDRDHEALLATLEQRFTRHMSRHAAVRWSDVAMRLRDHATAWTSLLAMERTGGEPDVVQIDAPGDALTFVDCSAESPSGRRSVCYDRAGLESRKEHPPAHSAIEMAAEMGVSLLTEGQYRALQLLGHFDLKTSSWILTPAPIRERGGALFCDRRYDTVFTYHNGAQSYYGVRGFRAILWV
jgi:hypothetical protein